jgi:hypothetical protein
MKQQRKALSGAGAGRVEGSTIDAAMQAADRVPVVDHTWPGQVRQRRRYDILVSSIVDIAGINRISRRFWAKQPQRWRNGQIPISQVERTSADKSLSPPQCLAFTPCVQYRKILDIGPRFWCFMRLATVTPWSP